MGNALGLIRVGQCKAIAGVYFFIRDEALHELKMTETAFRKPVSRLTGKGRVVRIRRGFYSMILCPTHLSQVKVHTRCVAASTLEAVALNVVGYS